MKRILIISDTHRSLANLRRVLEKEKQLDALIHLGDIEGEEQELRTLVDCRVEMVAGNNDYFSQLPSEKLITLAGYRIFLTHGHQYYINMGNKLLKQEAQARGAQIVMYGHTHRPVVDISEGVTALNPGSLSYPRQENKIPSYILMDIDTQGRADFSIRYLQP